MKNDFGLVMDVIERCPVIELVIIMVLSNLKLLTWSGMYLGSLFVVY